jgi:hypothetical protein
MAQDLKNQWDEISMGCMPHGTKEIGDQKFSGCTIRVEPTRDGSSGDEITAPGQLPPWTACHIYNTTHGQLAPWTTHPMVGCLVRKLFYL